ncbi:hypothetical protein EYR36_001741 [Pleurotus pulmonarius]|nr:hypothetical protein EYR36_001741 [Pleurotus pulmonarius]
MDGIRSGISIYKPSGVCAKGSQRDLPSARSLIVETKVSASPVGAAPQATETALKGKAEKSVSMVSTRRSVGSKPLHSSVHPAKHSHSREVVSDLRRSRHPYNKAPSDRRKEDTVKNDDDISMASGEEVGDNMAVDDEAELLAPSARPDVNNTHNPFCHHLHTHTVNTDVRQNRPYMFNEGMTASQGTAPTRVLVQMPSAAPSRRVFVTEVDKICSIIGSVDQSNKGGAQGTLDIGVSARGEWDGGSGGESDAPSRQGWYDDEGESKGESRRGRAASEGNDAMSDVDDEGDDRDADAMSRIDAPARGEWDGGSGGESDGPSRQGWHDDDESKRESRRGRAASEGNDAMSDVDDEGDDRDADAMSRIDAPARGEWDGGSGGESDAPSRQGWYDDEGESKRESRRRHSASEGNDAMSDVDDEGDDRDADAMSRIDAPARGEWDGGSGGESDAPSRQGWYDDEGESKGESRRGRAASEGDDAMSDVDDEGDGRDADAMSRIDAPARGEWDGGSGGESDDPSRQGWHDDDESKGESRRAYAASEGDDAMSDVDDGGGEGRADTSSNFHFPACAELSPDSTAENSGSGKQGWHDRNVRGEESRSTYPASDAMSDVDDERDKGDRDAMSDVDDGGGEGRADTSSNFHFPACAEWSPDNTAENSGSGRQGWHDHNVGGEESQSAYPASDAMSDVDDEEDDRDADAMSDVDTGGCEGGSGSGRQGWHDHNVGGEESQSAYPASDAMSDVDDEEDDRDADAMSDVDTGGCEGGSGSGRQGWHDHNVGGEESQSAYPASDRPARNGVDGDSMASTVVPVGAAGKGIHPMSRVDDEVGKGAAKAMPDVDASARGEWDGGSGEDSDSAGRHDHGEKEHDDDSKSKSLSDVDDEMDKGAADAVSDVDVPARGEWDSGNAANVGGDDEAECQNVYPASDRSTRNSVDGDSKPGTVVPVGAAGKGIHPMSRVDDEVDKGAAKAMSDVDAPARGEWDGGSGEDSDSAASQALGWHDEPNDADDESMSNGDDALSYIDFPDHNEAEGKGDDARLGSHGGQEDHDGEDREGEFQRAYLVGDEPARNGRDDYAVPHVHLESADWPFGVNVPTHKQRNHRNAGVNYVDVRDTGPQHTGLPATQSVIGLMLSPLDVFDPPYEGRLPLFLASPPECYQNQMPSHGDGFLSPSDGRSAAPRHDDSELAHDVSDLGWDYDSGPEVDRVEPSTHDAIFDSGTKAYPPSWEYNSGPELDHVGPSTRDSTPDHQSWHYDSDTEPHLPAWAYDSDSMPEPSFDNSHDRNFWGHHGHNDNARHPFEDDAMHRDRQSPNSEDYRRKNGKRRPRRPRHCSDSDTDDEFSGSDEDPARTIGKRRYRRWKCRFHPGSADEMVESDDDPPRTYNIKHHNPKNLTLKSQVRYHCDRTLMGRSVKQATLEMIGAFQYHPHGEVCPSIDNFCVDIREDAGLLTPWNNRLREVFVEDFMKQPDYTCKDPDKIDFHFTRHLKQLRNRVKGLPTPEAAKAKSRENRRRSLRERRVKACRYYAQQDPSLRRFADLLARVPYYGMSGDETDVAANVSIGNGKRVEGYSITNLPWRSSDPQVTNWFRTFDRLHLTTRYLMTGNPTPGEWPRTRLPSSRIEKHKATPPLGLPENLYDSAFLQGLHPLERQRLKVKPAIDLSFSAEIETLAARYAHIHTRHDRPLP